MPGKNRATQRRPGQAKPPPGFFYGLQPPLPLQPRLGILGLFGLAGCQAGAGQFQAGGEPEAAALPEYAVDTGITVQADVNGDGMADLEFSLRDVHSISVRDFIL